MPMIIMPQWDIFNRRTRQQKLLHVFEKPRLVVTANFIKLQILLENSLIKQQERHILPTTELCRTQTD